MDGYECFITNENCFSDGSSVSVSGARWSTISTSSNELVAGESSSLQERVCELERRVADQEDELVCLRSSMADVLRRLNAMDSSAGAVSPATPTRGGLSPKQFSRSSSNVRKPRSTLSIQENGLSTPKTRRTVSPSPHRLNGAMTSSVVHYRKNKQNGEHSGSGSRVSQNDANIRKWRSNVDFSRPQQCLAPSPSSPNPKGFSMHGLPPSGCRKSTSGLNLSSSQKNLAFEGHNREPVYNAEEGCLKLFLRNRPVSLYAPTSVLENENYNLNLPLEAPEESLQLEWVYGYRGRDCRSNIFYLPTGELVYFTASIIVLHNVEEQTQRHYTQHTDEVKCLDVHPNRLVIASGQSGSGRQSTPPNRISQCSSFSSPDSEVAPETFDLSSLPHVRVWNPISLDTIHIVGLGDFERSVTCVSFSKADAGILLAVVDESYEHTLSIWEWHKRRKVAATKSANEQVLACEWHPTVKNMLVTCGKSQVNFWTLADDSIQRRIGLLEGRDRPKYILSIAFMENGTLLSGDSNGCITMWNPCTGKILQQVPRAHDGGIFSMTSFQNGRIISGGGKDRRLVEWDEELKPTGRTSQLSELVGPVRHITPGKGSLMIVGTTHNCILEGSFHLQNFTTVIQGHRDEVSGLCSHASQQHFMTCGLDRMLKMWDSMSRVLIWCKELTDPAQCVCMHPNGMVVVVGTTIGKWIVLDVLTRELISTQSDGSHVISCVEFSPGFGRAIGEKLAYVLDGSMLAVAIHDGSLFVYHVNDDGRKYSRIGKCAGHTSFVTHIDWSCDGSYIRSNSGDNDVLHWCAKSCRPVTAVSVFRDIEWMTQRCVLTFDTAGIWNEHSDGTEIAACDVSGPGGSSLLAVADHVGIKLFKFPVSKPYSLSNVFTGHTAMASSVRFLTSGMRMISTGAKDCSILQWKLVTS